MAKIDGLFRGVLDVRARVITDGMASAAAHELGALARERGIDESDVLPHMDEWAVHARVAAAAGLAAQEEGVARLTRSREQLIGGAETRMREAREATELLMRAGLIPEPPQEEMP